MTTATAPQLFEAGKTILDVSRACTLKMVDGIPADKLCHVPVPGANHAIWVLGHCATTDSFFAGIVGERPSVVDESWSKLFWMGSESVDDPSVYPSLDEITSAMEQARGALLETFQSMDEKQLIAAVPEKLKPFAPNVGGIMYSVAWHEGFHVGQLSAVRRSLGLERALMA